ncbi:MAG TPA: hypothetical protein VH134_04590 [Candidatus Dormibacteraeota bacterium]|nr:hypothetical protein [Candidatus Dormibacteraeota bacterium]
MRREVVRVLCALGVVGIAAVPATVGAASPQISIRSGRACGAAPYCLSPATLSVPAGATVLWHNLTAAPLVISRCTTATCPGLGAGTGPDTQPASSSLGTGSESGVTFTRPGTYNYAFVAGGIAVLSGTVTATAIGQAARAVTVVAPAPAAAAAVPAAPTRVTAVSPVISSATPLVPALTPAAAAPAAAQHVVTPSTGAAPPWALGVLLAGAGASLIALGRRRRRSTG